jgi:hypothetical protein
MPVTPPKVLLVLTIQYEELDLEGSKELIDKANEYGAVIEAKLIVPSTEVHLRTF